MQINLSDWPPGLHREIATIDPAAVSVRLRDRLNFERDYDDLDQYSAAIFVADEFVFMLQLYDNTPTGDFTLIAMDGLTDENAALNAFLTWSGISKSAVKWRRPLNCE